MSRKEEKKKGTSRKEKKNKRGNMPSTKRKRKKKGNVQERKEKKKRKRRRRKRQCAQPKKEKKGRKELDMGIFVYYATLFSSFNFLFILGRKLFDRSKHLGPHNLFFFLLTQPNTLQKILIFIFALKFYIYPILCLNKHTLIHTNYLTFLPQPNGQG